MAGKMKYISRIPYANRVVHVIKVSQRFLKIADNDIRYNYLGQIFPLKPTTLNLFINDICNSNCQMCHVWKNKIDSEITLDELKFILKDPLFKKLQYIGVSGGEPTLRKDLPGIFHVLVEKEPRIKGTGIITNAINSNDVLSRIISSAEVCKSAGVSFNVMVSLDGVGEIHDQIRGIDGNFDNAVRVIRFFRDETDIPINIACTITKGNVWHLDEVLEFCCQEKVAVRFRVAEFIHRLSNQNCINSIRNFSDREAYNLGLFFTRLENGYETSIKIKRTYRNISKMLMDKPNRTIGCPYQSTAVALDCRGQLLYCAPKSPILGECLNVSAQKIYFKNIKKRKEILKKYCKNCIHDYHSTETFNEWLESRKNSYWKKKLSIDDALVKSKSHNYNRKLNINRNNIKNKSCKKFLIIGWYGTETAGDKAILGEIIHSITKEYNNPKLVLASIYPYISKRTVKELGQPNIKIIPTYSSDFWKFIKRVDVVIMGGGPLMHLDALGFVLLSFFRAKKANKFTHIWGCGIGPLNKNKKYEEAVKTIISLADRVELRDQKSAEWAIAKTKRTDIINIGDPAFNFVKRWMISNKRDNICSTLCLCLRDWPNNYKGNLDHNQFNDIKIKFEENLAQCILEICREFDLVPKLIPMHHFCIGNDDREFNRHFAKKYLSDLEPIIEIKPLSLHEILNSIYEARLSLCMRFHSIVFAEALEIPYVAIDYTMGGKIAGFLSDKNKEDRIISIPNIAQGHWRHTLFNIKKQLYNSGKI